MTEQRHNVVPLPRSGVDPITLLQQMVAQASGEVVEVVDDAELPVPPSGASPGAQSVWYGVLREFGDLGIARMRLLEQIVEVRSHYDRISAEWEASGAPMTSTGSMGQDVVSPYIAEMRALRQQEAGLWKQLDLSPERGGRRRPGRPTRAESHERGRSAKWGGR